MSSIVNLSGKTALITGSSKGLGAAIAKKYAEADAHVILLARNEEKLIEISNKIKSSGGHTTVIPCDVSNHMALKNVASSIEEKFGKLDIFVGNAAILGTLVPIQDIDLQEFQDVMNVNVTANFILLKTLHPLLKRSKNGRVILLTTGESVVRGDANWGGYAVSKAALESLARIYAEENKPGNICVNIVDPVKTRTDMRASAKPDENPMDLPHPDEIMDVFLDLASDDCTHHGKTIKAQ
jgi:NAD(P)-dependent dehydrogenase (short-subunit alcohol dehydrogenase family)